MTRMLSFTRRAIGKSLVPRVISVRGYHENIVEHYENPRNVGSFDKNDDSVGTVSLSLFRYLSDRYKKYSLKRLSLKALSFT
jgi:NifU-like N terminal domain